MTRRKIMTLLSGAGALFTASCQTSGDAAVGASNFSLPDAHGAAIRLSDYRGKVVLLDFWTTYCGACNIEIPWFIEFQSAYKDRGFTVLGVSLDEEGWKVLQRFLEKKKVNYPVVLGDNEVADRYSIQALPTTFLIDRHGKITASHVGLIDRTQFEAEIEALLR
jgi:cytochrome c biogenesis protein CcmG/thiol:disulfide interchange protein DsbE